MSMSTIVEAHVPAHQFALSDTLTTLPDVEFRMVRLVAHGGDSVMPFLWAQSEERERLTEALADDPTVGDVDVLAKFDDECLVQVDWQARIRVLVSIVSEENATILDAHGRNDTWRLQIFFPDHDSVSTVYDFCEEYGIDVTLERICDMSDSYQQDGIRLTEEQYQAISHAYEAGYYDVPRRVNQEELAESFDVSHQALSERLRRGHQTVIANMLYRKLQRPDRAVAPRMSHQIDG
jgi:predicted DNA binding protein